MPKLAIGIGSTANDGTGDTLRVAGGKINDNFSEIYTAIGNGSSITLTSTPAELNILDGVTASTAELNILDGVTSTAAELNILDGVTSTAAELNILDGVTASTAELNILDGVTASTAELNILDGVTASTAELNILDGATLTTTELNYVDGVTSAIQTQLNAKAASSSLATVATSGAYSDLTGKPSLFNGAYASLTGTPILFDGAYASLTGTPTIPTAASLSVDDLISLSGVAEGSINLGSFTGTTIADNQTIKQGLQALETAVEGKQASITTTLTLTVSTSVPATPANGMFAVADGNTAGWDPKGTNAGVSYPVFYNGSSWTALY
jgi:hypothetical protein